MRKKAIFVLQIVAAALLSFIVLVEATVIYAEVSPKYPYEYGVAEWYDGTIRSSLVQARLESEYPYIITNDSSKSEFEISCILQSIEKASKYLGEKRILRVADGKKIRINIIDGTRSDTVPEWGTNTSPIINISGEGSYVFAHEMFHNIVHDPSESYFDDYRMFSTADNADGDFASLYAARSKDEDLAMTFEYYYVNDGIPERTNNVLSSKMKYAEMVFNDYGK
jgi:hypothetical protein